MEDLEKSCSLGYLLVEAFTFLDRGGCIQDLNNVPIIYHVKRYAWNEVIRYSRDNTARNPEIKLILSQAIPKIDKLDKSTRNENRYKWLNVQ